MIALAKKIEKCGVGNQKKVFMSASQTAPQPGLHPTFKNKLLILLEIMFNNGLKQAVRKWNCVVRQVFYQT